VQSVYGAARARLLHKRNACQDPQKHPQVLPFFLIFSKQIASTVLEQQNRYHEFVVAMQSFEKESKKLQSAGAYNNIGKRMNNMTQQQQELEKQETQLKQE